MRRRELLVVLLGSALVYWQGALADTLRTIAILMAGSDADPEPARLLGAFRRSLAELGWREGVNLKIELRWGHNDEALIKTYAQELVSLKPDVIVAPSTSFSPLHEATRSIPVVFLLLSDPVGQGIVSSLSRPGGNLTGFTYMEFDTGGKLAELLKEIAPETRRVLVVLDADNRTTPQWWRSIEAAARLVGIEPQQGIVRHGGDQIESVIGAFATAKQGGIIVPPQSLFVAQRALLVMAAAREHLPAVYGLAPFGRAGGLLSYGVDAADQFMRAGTYIDRILKGTSPGDLPVQQPTKFELVINLKTANALGLTVPQSLLARADEVIE